MEKSELRILEALDISVRLESTRILIDERAARVERALNQNPDENLAWEPIPLEFYTSPLPEEIRSSWVFILRAHATTGPERHPNSHQRMMSYRGSGDFQTRNDGIWESHFLKSEQSDSFKKGWISIPPGIWHQGVVGTENWVVVSFQTVLEKELIEERPESGEPNTTRQRKYIND